MLVVSVVLAVAIAFAVAAVVMGREVRRLDAEPPRPVFDLDEAVEFVAERLPFEVSAVLSHDDVRRVVEWSLEFFRQKGVSGNGDHTAQSVPLVVGEAETVDYVLTRGRTTGHPMTPPQVRAVLDAHMQYLEAIGAVGPEAPPDALDDPPA